MFYSKIIFGLVFTLVNSLLIGQDISVKQQENLTYKDDGYAYFYMTNAAEQYYKDKSIAIDYNQKFVTYKDINKELEVMADQRIKALKEQAFMHKK